MASTHSEQLPSLQTFPPSSVHLAPSSRNVLVGWPASQRLSVHWEPSSNTSLPSSIAMRFPSPSHQRFLQSPRTCDAILANGLSSRAQAPASQVAIPQ